MMVVNGFKLGLIRGVSCVLLAFRISYGVGRLGLFSFLKIMIAFSPSLSSVASLFASVVFSILVSLGSRMVFVDFVGCSFFPYAFCNFFFFCGGAPSIFVSQSERI